MGQTEKFGQKGRQDLFMFDPEDIVLIKDKDHPLYDPRVEMPVDKFLVKNIMTHGILEPISVRNNGEKGGKPIIECVYGRQRVKAAIEANKLLEASGNKTIRVPARIMHGEDSSLFGAMISENELRKDDSPIQKARKIQRYIAMGRSTDEAAVAFGVTGQTIRNHLSLLDCNGTVLKAVEKGEIGAALAATQISKLPREEQSDALDKLLKSGTTKGEAAVKNVKRMRNGKGAEKAAPRMRRRKDIAKAVKVLAKLDRKDADAMAAVLKWVLGSDNAFGKEFSIVESTLYPGEASN